MIEAVTFDVWETIITDPKHLEVGRAQARAAQVAEALREAGEDLDLATVEAAYATQRKRLDGLWEHCFEVDTRDQVMDLLHDLDPGLQERLDEGTIERVEHGYVYPFFDIPPMLAKGARETISSVKDRGCAVGLICNTGRTPGWAIRRLLTAYGVLSLFDAVAFSNEEGVRKPHREIFARTLQRLGVSEAQTIHVGDDPVTDIWGAKSAGLGAVCIGSRSPAVLSRMRVQPDAYIAELPELVDVMDRLG